MVSAVFKYAPQPAATTFLFIDFLKYISVKLKLHNSFHYFTSNRQQRKKTHLLRVREKNYLNPCVVHKSFQRRLLPSLLYVSFFYAPHPLTAVEDIVPFDLTGWMLRVSLILWRAQWVGCEGILFLVPWWVHNIFTLTHAAWSHISVLNMYVHIYIYCVSVYDCI